MKKIIVFLMTFISIICILFSMSFTTFAKEFNVKKQDYICGDAVFDSNGRLKKYTDGSSFTEYTYDKNGNIIKTVEYNDEYDSWSVQDYSYNNAGKVTKSNFWLWYGEGKANSSTLVNTYTFTYDSSNRLIKRVNKQIEGNYIRSFTYTYDDFDRIIKSTCKEPDGNSITSMYTYDKNGNLIKEEEKYNSGNPYTRIYTYDKSGNLINDGITVYTFDKTGNLIKEISEYNTRSYTYDNLGNLIKTEDKYSDGRACIETYTYDNSGNLVKKIEKFSDGFTKTNNYSFKKNNRTIYFLNVKENFSPDPIFDRQSCVILFNDKQEYTGKAITPMVNVLKHNTDIDWGGCGYDAAINGVDYTVTYSNNTKVGTGKIKIHFLHSDSEVNFNGYKDVEIPFTICKHKYDAGKITKAATCKATGTRTYTCSLCKGTKTETIAKKAHKFDEGKITKASTCTVKGVKTFTCTVCKGTITEAVALKAHKYTSAVTKATTAKDGKVVKTCSVCKKSTSAVVPKVSSISLAATTYTYNGSVRTPSVTVKDSKGKVLKNGTDYTVTYSSGRKEVGSYTAKVTLKGNYSGSKTFTFKITLGKVTGLYQTSAKGIGLSWNAVPGASGYEVVLTTNNGSTTKTTTKTTLSSASAKGSAKVKVRAYRTVNGKKVYGAYSSTITAKAK